MTKNRPGFPGRLFTFGPAIECWSIARQGFYLCALATIRKTTEKGPGLPSPSAETQTKYFPPAGQSSRPASRRPAARLRLGQLRFSLKPKIHVSFVWPPRFFPQSVGAFRNRVFSIFSPAFVRVVCPIQRVVHRGGPRLICYRQFRLFHHRLPTASPVAIRWFWQVLRS